MERDTWQYWRRWKSWFWKQKLIQLFPKLMWFDFKHLLASKMSSHLWTPGTLSSILKGQADESLLEMLWPYSRNR